MEGKRKMEDLEFINKFSKIKVASICQKLKINRSNVYNGRTTDENLKRVRSEIESEIAKLYIIEGK